METLVYNVGDLRRLISENVRSEFKPVIGPNVESDDKKNNEESYKNSEKRAKDFDGGLNEPEKIKLGKKIDGNRTTIEYNPEVEPDEKYKERVAAQAKGYTSAAEEKNGIPRGGVEMDDEGRILKQFTDARDEREKIKKDLEKSGLAARTYPDSAFDKNHLVNENKLKPKRLKFKRTRFVNEQQALSKIPEEYKVDGQRIHLVDADDTEYIVECSLSQRSGMVETNIVHKHNQRVMEEQVNRLFELMDYKSPKGQTRSEKLQENTMVGNLLNITRENED